MNLAQTITDVANQLRVYVREEERRQAQQNKVRERLNKRRETAKMPNPADELRNLEREEKRLRALRLKEKMKLYR